MFSLGELHLTAVSWSQQDNLRTSLNERRLTTGICADGCTSSRHDAPGVRRGVSGDVLHVNWYAVCGWHDRGRAIDRRLVLERGLGLEERREGGEIVHGCQGWVDGGWRRQG